MYGLYFFIFFQCGWKEFKLMFVIISEINHPQNKSELSLSAEDHKHCHFWYQPIEGGGVYIYCTLYSRVLLINPLTLSQEDSGWLPYWQIDTSKSEAEEGPAALRVKHEPPHRCLLSSFSVSVQPLVEKIVLRSWSHNKKMNIRASVFFNLMYFLLKWDVEVMHNAGRIYLSVNQRDVTPAVAAWGHN